MLTRRRITVALAMLTVERSAEAASRHLIRPERARILPAGALIVDALLERFAAERLHVSEEGIRSGLLLGDGGRRAGLARPAPAAGRRLVRGAARLIGRAGGGRARVPRPPARARAGR